MRTCRTSAAVEGTVESPNVAGGGRPAVDRRRGRQNHGNGSGQIRIERRRGGRAASSRNLTSSSSCLEMAPGNDNNKSSSQNSSQNFATHPPPKLKIRFREKLGAGEVVTMCNPVGLELNCLGNNAGNLNTTTQRMKEGGQRSQEDSLPPSEEAPL